MVEPQKKETGEELTPEESVGLRDLFDKEKELIATVKDDQRLLELVKKTTLKLNEDINAQSLERRKAEWAKYIRDSIKEAEEGGLTAKEQTKLREYSENLLNSFFENIKKYIELEQLAIELREGEIVVQKLRDVERVPEAQREKAFLLFLRELNSRQRALLPQREIVWAENLKGPLFHNTIEKIIKEVNLLILRQQLIGQIEGIWKAYKGTVRKTVREVGGRRLEIRESNIKSAIDELLIYQKGIAKLSKARKFLSLFVLRRKYNKFLDSKFRKVFAELIDDPPEEFSDPATKNKLKVVLESSINLLKVSVQKWKFVTVLFVAVLSVGIIIATMIKNYNTYKITLGGVSKKMILLDPTSSLIGAMMILASLPIGAYAMKMYSLETSLEKPPATIF